MIKGLEKAITDHCINSKKLKTIYIGNDKLSYKKSKELQEQQKIEYDKMMFLKNLKKEFQKEEKEGND